MQVQVCNPKVSDGSWFEVSFMYQDTAVFWLALRNKLAVKTRPCSWGVIEDDLCCFCNCRSEEFCLGEGKSAGSSREQREKVS